MYYTEKEILTCIKERDEINFLASVVTPLHVLGVEAAIYHLVQKGIKLIGYIVIVPHPKTGYAVSSEFFHKIENVDIKIIYLSSKAESKGLKQKVVDKWNLYHYYLNCEKKNKGNQLFYYLKPFEPSFYRIPKVASIKKDWKLQIIVTEEGLASYTPDLLKKNESKWSTRVKDKIIGTEWFMRSLKKANMVSYFLFLKREEDSWVRNNECTDAFKAVLSMNKAKDEFSYYENAVIINTTLLYEDGLIDGDIDILLLADIVETLRKNGNTVIIKPHPREKRLDRYKDLDCIIEQKYDISQESVLTNLKVLPKCILGFNSTTLVTAKILFNVRTISLNAGIDRQYLTDKKYLETFKRWIDFVEIPKTAEELKKVINEI